MKYNKYLIVSIVVLLLSISSTAFSAPSHWDSLFIRQRYKKHRGTTTTTTIKPTTTTTIKPTTTTTVKPTTTTIIKPITTTTIKQTTTTTTVVTNTPASQLAGITIDDPWDTLTVLESLNQLSSK